MKVMVIAPHMDDEVLGLGGTIARHVASGDEVYVCFVAHRVYDHKFDEAQNATEIQSALNAKEVLGYKEAQFFNLDDERLDACIQDVLIPLEKYLEDIKPEVVYINHGGDNHQDHKAVFQAGMVVLRPAVNVSIKRIMCYEVSSSTVQSPPLSELAFLPNYYVNIEKYLSTKLEALHCYQTENRAFPHPRSNKAIEALAMKRGTEAGINAAEAFMVLKELW